MYSCLERAPVALPLVSIAVFCALILFAKKCSAVEHCAPV